MVSSDPSSLSIAHNIFCSSNLVTSSLNCFVNEFNEDLRRWDVRRVPQCHECGGMSE
jgi:hypothetical protein